MTEKGNRKRVVGACTLLKLFFAQPMDGDVYPFERTFVGIGPGFVEKDYSSCDLGVIC